MSEGDIKVILDRIDRMDERLLSMDERLSQGIASLAKGQETIGLLVNDIHGSVIKAGEGAERSSASPPVDSPGRSRSKMGPAPIEA